MLDRFRQTRSASNVQVKPAWQPQIKFLSATLEFVAVLRSTKPPFQEHRITDSMSTVFRDTQVIHQAVHVFADQYGLPIADCPGVIDERLRWWPCGQTFPVYPEYNLQVAMFSQGFKSTIRHPTCPVLDQPVLSICDREWFGTGEIAHQAGHQQLAKFQLRPASCSGFIDAFARQRACPSNESRDVVCQIKVVKTEYGGFMARAYSVEQLVDLRSPFTGYHPVYQSGQTAHREIHAQMDGLGLVTADCSGYESDQGQMVACEYGNLSRV